MEVQPPSVICSSDGARVVGSARAPGSERLVGDARDRRYHAGGLALARDVPVAIAQLRLARRQPDTIGARWRCATRETAPTSGCEYHCHTAFLTDVCTVVYKRTALSLLVVQAWRCRGSRRHRYLLMVSQRRSLPMTLAPPFLSCTCPPFLVLAHTLVLARSQLPACSHRRDLGPAFPAGDLRSEWEWTLASCHPRGPHHSSVVECTASGSLTLPSLSPLMTRLTTRAGGGACVRRREGYVGEASRDRI